MTKAFENALKMSAWVDPVALGADPTGVIAADSYMAQAVASGLEIRIPAGVTIRLANAITKALTIGQDFILTGAGAESSRLVFGATATDGIAISYSTNATGQSQGDKSAIRIGGLDIETERAGGGSAVSIINSPPVGQVNETQVALDLFDLRTNGASDAAYWDIHTELENVTFPSLRDMEAQDSAGRGVGLSLNSNGDYSAVEFAIDNYRANAVGTGLKVRGRCEGVYASHFVAVGGAVGIDWVATPVAGAKKPLLSLEASHINVTGTAVKAEDVSQIIGANTLIYVTNSAVTENVGFDFTATGAISNENHQVKGVTLIGLGSRVGSLCKGVKLGANVAGCVIDALIDNLGVAVANAGVNNFISPSSKISNCNVRTTGFADLGAYGETGTTASVDGSLQMEISDGTDYARDQGREQLRVESFTFVSSAIDETITHALVRAFRTDTAMLMASFGAVPSTGSQVFPNLANCTAANLEFKTIGTTIGATYRINYIAYGY